jgi:cytochrome c551/c552
VSDPQAATASAAATTAPTPCASETGRFTNATVPDDRAATLASVSRVSPSVRVVLGVVTTVVLASTAACGADGPRTALERGEAIYGANCGQCHGTDLGGTDRGPSLLDPVYAPAQLTDAALADAIRNGVEERLWDFGPMPANGAITDEQIDAIVAFVRARQAAGPDA